MVTSARPPRRDRGRAGPVRSSSCRNWIVYEDGVPDIDEALAWLESICASQ